MNRVIAFIVLVVFCPVQLYAGDKIDFNYQGFGADDTRKEEYFVPRSLEGDQKLSEKILEGQPDVVDPGKSGANWWLWGGVGLAVVAGGILAASAGGSKGGSTSGGGGGGAGAGASTTTVTGSW